MDHPNVVRVHDHDVDLHGSPVSYIVYEYLDGPTLEEWAPKHTPRMSEVIEILMQICLGVQAIHTLPIVHRDLKPSNIIMLKGRPVIADFGIAAHADDDQSVAGSPKCMAPEQLTHDADSTLVDIYGIGAVAFFLLAGEYPNGNSDAMALAFLASKDEVDLSKVPKRIRHILKGCLARRPADRYQSAEAIRIALVDLKHFRGSGLPKQQVGTRTALFARRNAIGLLGLFVVLAVLLTTILNQREQVKQGHLLRMQVEEMKGTFQKTILDARLRDGELNPATYWAIIELSKVVPEWEVWSYAALTTMDGEMMLRSEVESHTRDASVSRITVAYWWWLLAKVERAAGRKEEVYRSSFEQAKTLLVSKLGEHDPLVESLKLDMIHGSSEGESP